jgi:Tol biopolymer transport system component
METPGVIITPLMPLTSGTKIGPYEIGSLLGVGGMGEVYRSRDNKLGREVALKVLPSALAGDSDRLGRVSHEAKVLAALNHPNIAAIYGVEDSGATHALVMELVEGPTIADRIKAGPIPLEEALPIAKQIAEAVEYAHERGIVHRDLKPANIKVTQDDKVKVLDFGLAKALQDDPSAQDISDSPTLSIAATKAGIILGTAGYMSPEQARGKPVDRRSDIWAFGCVFYEMLTGKVAFSGETVSDTLAAVIRAEPDWNAVPELTPASIRKLLRRCLEKNSKRRLQAIGEARVAIEETLSGDAETPALDGEVTREQPLRKSAWLIGLGGLIAGALLAGIAAWKWFATVSSPTAMHFSAVTNFAGVQAQPALSPDGRSVAFVSNRDGKYNIYVGLISGGNLVQITHESNLVSRPRYSPDGTTITFSRLNSSGIWDIWEVPALGGTPRRLILNAMAADWSPDGRSLAYQDLATETIWICDPSGQNGHKVMTAESWSRNTEPRFSPNGREIAFVIRLGGPYGELAVADINTGKVRALTHDNALALSPAWSPDSSRIYFASSRGGTMNIWKVAAAGDAPEQITAGQGDDAELDLSSDGKRIVFSTYRDNINIFESDLSAKAGAEIRKQITSDPARNQLQPAYSPDGEHLAYFSNRKGAEKEGIWVANVDGSAPIQLVHDDWQNYSPRWTPDGEHLIFGSYDLSDFEHPKSLYRRVSISGGAPQTILKDVSDGDVGPDGRLVFRGSEGKIQTFDPTSNKMQTLAKIPLKQNWGNLRWSPDGKSVAYRVNPSKENDPDAGLWVDDFKSPPRQVFRGWALWFASGPKGEIFVLEAHPDLRGIFWKVGWNGQGLARTSTAVPLIYSYWSVSPEENNDYFDISPDGRHLAYNPQGVQQANIGMIENIR